MFAAHQAVLQWRRVQELSARRDRRTGRKAETRSETTQPARASGCATVPPLVARVLLNLLMLLRRVPAALQTGRTAFILKSSPATEAGHFRPITVAPVLQRLFHKALSRRLTAAVGLHFGQWVFQLVDGCAENVVLLATAIVKAKQRLRPLYMTSVYLTKAFGRVSTEAIVRGPYVLGESLLVEPTTGVRQGDLLSPTMFNLVLDEYLAATDTNAGFSSGDFCLDAMAFADDLLVFTSTGMGLQERLNELAAFLKPRELLVNVGKSFALVLQPSGRAKKSKVETDMVFSIRDHAALSGDYRHNVAVPWKGAEEWTGTFGSSWIELPGRPFNRSSGYSSSVASCYLGCITDLYWASGVKGPLTKLDKKTRAATCKWLALIPRHSSGILPRPSLQGRTGGDFAPDCYPGDHIGQDLGSLVQRGCEAALRCGMLLDQVRRAQQAASFSGIPLTNKADIHKYWAEMLHGSFDRAALRDARHVPAAQTKRGRPDDVSFRAGCRARESLDHVLRACHRDLRARVKRHDNIGRYVAMRLHQLKWSVLWEPHDSVQGKVMKPVLVATKEHTAVIIDVQAVGTGIELVFVHQQKAAKYTVPELQRGIWYKDSAKDLLSLGLTKSDLKIMTVRCLQGGLRCF
ncbi:hypothetical protein HPB47_005934 [Ixodes persulcatus]|uniref:Uncharacterized protein n=1 Tax=Ixodes persulcatus TaxID=34615 RepID=A0AC60PC75_IXOPE|nr:hypothetical protein HPB47_005934 [Ixodes persulcatus]